MSKRPLTHKMNTKLCQMGQDGFNAIRVYHRKPSKKKSPRYLFKCGCCNEKVEIYYDKGDLEINGVIGSIENWRELLLPLLGIKHNKREKT